MCLNFVFVIYFGDKFFFFYICSDCADELRKEYSEYIIDILLLMFYVFIVCENKVKFLFV